MKSFYFMLTSVILSKDYGSTSCFPKSHPVLGKLAVEAGNAVQHGLILLKYYLCHKI